MADKIGISPKMFVNQNEKKFTKFYKIGGVLGTGAFGEVRKCKHLGTNQIRAVKLFTKSSINEFDLPRIFDELNLLKELDHPNIVKIYEYFQDSKYIYVIIEFCEGGELFSKIIEDGSLQEAVAANYMVQILSALAYCHQKGIIHRDMKPENILLDSKLQGSNIKLADFGTAHLMKNFNEKLTDEVGTPYYIAPEILKGKYDQKCDIWSVGVILYIMLCGYPPFNANTDKEIMQKVAIGKYTFDEASWGKISKEAKAFISNLLTVDPSKRTTALFALKDPWIAKYTTKVQGGKIKSPELVESLKNIRQFRGGIKLKQASMMYIMSQLIGQEDKKELALAFNKLDANGDGKLSKEELLSGYQKVMGEAISEEEITKMFEALDADKSGSIDYSEFLLAAMGQKKILTHQNLKEAFNLFDKDKNGLISASEIKAILGSSNLSKTTYKNLIKEIDENGDDQICFDEFEKMMSRLEI